MLTKQLFKPLMLTRKITQSIRCRKQVELTSQRYPNLSRGKYSQLEENDVNYFKEIVGKFRVVTDSEDLMVHNTDWLKTCRGTSKLMIQPTSTEQVSQVLQYCNERNLAVCPQGGNTGLVGGSVPVFDEVIVSTSLMNKIISFDSITGILQCQAGCILENLEQYVKEHNYLVPIDLGAKGSCHIGGNVATNAGGIRLLRYGSLLGNILGLEVVLASGEILDLTSTLRKDNTGYNLKHLFIGSEGTLGVITKVCILCSPRPHSSTLSFLGCESYDDLLKCLKSCKMELAEHLQSFEMLDHEALSAVTQNLNLQSPIGQYPFYLVVEAAGSSKEYIEELLEKCLGKLTEANVVKDCILTSDSKRMLNLWALRERITEAVSIDGYVYKYDISLPIDKFYEIVEVMRKRLGKAAVRCCGYGHMGDGNIHLNITSKEYDPELINAIEPFVYDWTAKNKGSISAEHGLGLKKKNYIYCSKPKEAVKLMKRYKQLMDPNQILNPYKVLPSE